MMPSRRMIAPAYGVVAAAMAFGCVGLLVAHLASGRGHFPPEWQFTLPLGMVAALLGDVLLRRRPDQKLGWVVAAIGMTVLFQTLVTLYADYSLYVRRLPSTAGVFSLASIPSGTLIALLSLLFLLFPTGTLPGRRWRVVAAVLVVTTSVGMPGQIGGDPSDTDFPQLPNPLQTHSALVHNAASVVSILQIFVLLACAASVALRWRRGDELIRRQIKVLLAAALLWPPVVLVLVLAPSSFGDSIWGQLLFAIPVLTMVVAVYVAVARYRLYEIDRVISRTVSYVVVTGILVGSYVGVVALTTQLLPFSSSVGVAPSTLFVAAAFHPVRRRVQGMVDRRFNRQRYDAA